MIDDADSKIHTRCDIDQGTVTTTVTVDEHFDMYQVVISRKDNAGSTEFNKQEFFMSEEQLSELNEFFQDLSSKMYRKRTALQMEEWREKYLAEAAAQKDFVESDIDHIDLQRPNLFRDITDGTVIKQKMRSSKDYCVRFYGTLCNNGLSKYNYETSYSWRAVGGLIADILGEGDYMNWYCSGGEGRVDEEVEKDLNWLGWLVHSDYYDKVVDSMDPSSQMKLGENDEK